MGVEQVSMTSPAVAASELAPVVASANEVTTPSNSSFSSALTRAVADARSLQTVTLADMVASATGRPTMTAAAFTSQSPTGAFMSRATSSGSTGRLGAAGAAASSRRPPVPAELANFGNGRIPSEALSEIGIARHRLWAPASESFRVMRAAAAAEGVDIGVTDSYRDYDEQVDLARRKGLYQNGGLAAVPGTSQHGWGRALDVDVTPQGLEWMRSNAARFGWVEAVPREPWHWEFWGVTG